MPETSSDAVLSVVMPCFNEEATVLDIIDAVLTSPVVGELVVVDDASTDGTIAMLKNVDDPRVHIIYHDVNAGKGAALRSGFAAVSGFPFVVVLRPMLDDRADVVFGSRFQGADEHRVLYFWHTMGNRFLTLLSNTATNLNLTDMETWYKMFRREIIEQIVIEEDRFGVEPELTAKVARMGCRVYEVGISYHGRTFRPTIGRLTGGRA